MFPSSSSFAVWYFEKFFPFLTCSSLFLFCSRSISQLDILSSSFWTETTTNGYQLSQTSDRRCKDGHSYFNSVKATSAGHGWLTIVREEEKVQFSSWMLVLLDLTIEWKNLLLSWPSREGRDEERIRKTNKVSVYPSLLHNFWSPWRSQEKGKSSKTSFFEKNEEHQVTKLKRNNFSTDRTSYSTNSFFLLHHRLSRLFLSYLFW